MSGVPKDLVLASLLYIMEADDRRSPSLQDVVVDQIDFLKFELKRIQALGDEVVDLLKGLKDDAQRLEDIVSPSSIEIR